MMKIIVYGALAVGMRHYDATAIASVESAHSRRKRASLQRSHAAIIAGLFGRRPRLIKIDTEVQPWFLH